MFADLLKIWFHYALFCTVVYVAAYTTWQLIGWEWSPQVFKDCLLYAIVFRVFQIEAKNEQ